MDSNYINVLSNRYESVLSAQMTTSLGKSVINLYSNIACSALGVGNQQDLSNDLECNPFLNPSDTKGFGRPTSDTKGGGRGVGPTPWVSHNSFDVGT